MGAWYKSDRDRRLMQIYDISTLRQLSLGHNVTIFRRVAIGNIKRTPKRIMATPVLVIGLNMISVLSQGLSGSSHTWAIMV